MLLLPSVSEVSYFSVHGVHLSVITYCGSLYAEHQNSCLAYIAFLLLHLQSKCHAVFMNRKVFWELRWYQAKTTWLSFRSVSVSFGLSLGLSIAAVSCLDSAVAFSVWSRLSTAKGGNRITLFCGYPGNETRTISLLGKHFTTKLAPSPRQQHALKYRFHRICGSF